MSILHKLSSWLPTTRGAMQAAVNKAREDMRGDNVQPRRSEKPVDVYDADYRPDGLSYSVLRGFGNQCEPVRLCINRLKTSLSRLDYDILPVDEDAPNDAEIKQGEQWFSEEGGFGRPGTRIREALEELTEDLLVCGCIATYYRPTRAAKAGVSGPRIASIEPIDAATIIPKRDANGWVPQPPVTAYVQKLRTDGTRTIPFTTDELGYWVWGSRTYSSYGQSFVECCFSSVLQYQAADIYNLVWYTEGDNVLGYWHYTGSGEVTPQEVQTFREWLRKQKNISAQRGRSAADMTPPAGWKYESFRPRSEAEYIETQKFLMQRIAPFFGLTPTALGQDADAYKSSQKAIMEQSVREAVTPLATFFDDVFTAILQGPLGLKSVRFQFKTDTIDQAQVAAVLDQAGNLFITPNEGREMLGLPVVSGGYADDMFFIPAAGEPVLIASTDKARAALIDERLRQQQEQDEQRAADDDAANAGGVGADGTTGGGGTGTGDAAGQSGQQQRRDQASPQQAKPQKSAVVADLRRWRDKARKAVRRGESAAVRFESDVIPADMARDISASLAVGADVGNVFAAKMGELDEPVATWADRLGAGLDGLIETLETQQ